MAINRLRDYNKLAPDDSDAQAEFGLMLADHNASREAAVTLEKVLHTNPIATICGGGSLLSK